MAKILYAWEFGSGLGHLMIARPILAELQLAGHIVALASPNPRTALGVISLSRMEYLQTPKFPLAITQQTRQVRCYAEMFLRFGMRNVDQVVKVLQGWIEIFRQFTPDAIVADYGTLVKLAARACGIPVLQLGHGFLCPPVTINNQPYDPQFHIADQERQNFERELVQCLNQALRQLNHPPLASLGDWLQASATCLTTFEEWEYIPRPCEIEYYGPVLSTGGAEPIWPDHSRPKVFVYLHPQFAQAELFNWLARESINTLVYARELPYELVREFRNTTVMMGTKRFEMRAVARQADLAITHAGIGTIADFLLAGKPLVVLPVHLDQYLLAEKLKLRGQAVTANPFRVEDQIQRIRWLLDNLAGQSSVTAFAQKYAGYSTTETVQRIVGKIEEIA
jgi:UDP:flavonoid glycosyltransferase YjiC (YdhE family)